MRDSLEDLEAQASITVYLFSFNSGRVARRSGPLFFERFFSVECNLSGSAPVKDPEAQASITVYLFSFNSGRVARRSGPLFFALFGGGVLPLSGLV